MSASPPIAPKHSRRSEMSLCAKSRHSHCSKIFSYSFTSSARAGDATPAEKVACAVMEPGHIIVCLSRRRREARPNMKTGAAVAAALLAVTPAPWNHHPAIGQTSMLPAPGFHHLHLNSLDPASAIDFYTRQFASTSKAAWGGFPVLKSPTDVLI